MNQSYITQLININMFKHAMPLLEKTSYDWIILVNEPSFSVLKGHLIVT